MTNNTTTFGQKDCVNFTQLSNGKWVGHSFFGTFTSVETFEKDSTGGERFRDIEVQESTKEEIVEHTKLLGWG